MNKQTESKPGALALATVTDEHGITRGICACGIECSTHPDAGFSLDFCQTCGRVTCPDCREHETHVPGDSTLGRLKTCVDRTHPRRAVLDLPHATMDALQADVEALIARCERAEAQLLEANAGYLRVCAERNEHRNDAERLAGLLADAADLAWDHAPSELCGPLAGVNAALAAHRAGGAR
jgi:hypothetical protein